MNSRISNKSGEKARERFCVDCDKKLSTSAYYLKTKRCISCAIKYLYKTGKLNNKGMNNGNAKDGRSLKKYSCKFCDKKITWKTAIKGKKCCASCVRIGIKMSKKIRLKISKKMKGENHPNFGNRGRKAFGYINGKAYELYPEIFFELRESIRKRDDYTCQNCGMTEEEHLIVVGINLHIHHIDYNKKNCKEDNLITLCAQCNLRANGNRNYWENYYKLKMEKILCSKNE